MVVNQKVSGKAKPMMVGLALGTAVSLVITLLGAAVTANLILSDKIGTEAIGYAALLVLLLAGAVGAILAARMIKRRRMIVCMAAGAMYYLSLLAITALFFGGQYQGMGITAAVVFAGCGSVALLGLTGESKARKKRRKLNFR